MDEKYWTRSRLKWDKIVKSEDDGLPVLLIKNLLHLFGRRIDLHKIVWPDKWECFHSHPANWAIRIILWGGYVEEMHDGTMRRWWPGRSASSATMTSTELTAC